MTIEALQDYIVKQESMFDEVSNLINIYIESALSEYDINLKKIEYNVIKESKDESEEKELKGEAADGLVGKIRKAIVKLIDTVKKFCMNIYTKVSEKINDAKTQAAIKRAEKLAAKNKKLANTKIEVENTEAKLKATDKALDKLQTISSKLDAGKDVAFEEIENVVADHKKEMKAIGGATIAVMLIAGIGLLAKNKDKLPWIKDIGSGNKINEHLGRNVYDDIAADKAKKAVKCETEKANLLKQRASIIGSAVTSLLGKIKGAVNFKSEVPTPEVDSNVKDTINNTVDTVVKAAKSAHENLSDHDKIAMFHSKENTSEVDYDAQILEELANDIFADILAETTNIKDDNDIEEVEEASNEDKIINSLIDEINAENKANELVKEQEETEKLIDSLIKENEEVKEENVVDEDDKEIINMIDDIKSELNL